MKRYFFLLFLVFTITSCSSKNYIALQKSDYSDLKYWHDDEHHKALEAFAKSCPQKDKTTLKAQIYKKVPAKVLKEEWNKICKQVQNRNFSKKEAKELLETHFIPFLVKGNKGKQGLFTGYYEAELEGSEKKTTRFKYPVYLHSAKINTKLPRSEIDKGALKNKNLEVAYVEDKVELFFMHIQGSGKIRLGKNDYIKLSYASENGYPYFPIGIYLKENNLIDKNKVNAESIIKWLNKNPHQANNVMNLNESYIFFRRREEHHPIGAMGIEVTPMRTLAVDRNFIPLGSILWLETTYPQKNKDQPLKPLNRTMVAQDVGGAIKGAVRGDVFFGSNKQAQRHAWYMANKGHYYILVPKKIADYLDD